MFSLGILLQARQVVNAMNPRLCQFTHTDSDSTRPAVTASGARRRRRHRSKHTAELRDRFFEMFCQLPCLSRTINRMHGAKVVCEPLVPVRPMVHSSLS